MRMLQHNDFCFRWKDKTKKFKRKERRPNELSVPRLILVERSFLRLRNQQKLHSTLQAHKDGRERRF